MIIIREGINITIQMDIAEATDIVEMFDEHSLYDYNLEYKSSDALYEGLNGKLIDYNNNIKGS